MKIALVSDVTWGGAAVACRRLAAALRAHTGNIVEWIAARGEPTAGARVAAEWLPLWALVGHRLALRCPRLAGNPQVWQTRVLEGAVLAAVRRLCPEAINLHNLHDGLSFDLVSRLPRHVPVVWTLHDMWPLTGYCCHSRDCDRFLSGCGGECPQSGRWGPVLRAPEQEWQRRQRLVMQRRIVFVAPSAWLANLARERWGPSVRVECIPNSLDLERFHPVADRTAVRRVLGLPEQGSVLLTGAHWAADPLKGPQLLEAALELLAAPEGPRPLVVVFGETLPGDRLPAAWRVVGKVRDERLLNLYYNAADAYVLASLAENLPNTLIESLAAGTPAVAFDVGGCREVVQDGVTGYLARAGEPAHLAECVRRILALGTAERVRMREECRRAAVGTYAPGRQAARYGALFEELCGSGDAARGHGGRS